MPRKKSKAQKLAEEMALASLQAPDSLAGTPGDKPLPRTEGTAKPLATVDAASVPDDNGKPPASVQKPSVERYGEESDPMRPLSKEVVEQLAKDILAGEWKGNLSEDEIKAIEQGHGHSRLEQMQREQVDTMRPVCTCQTGNVNMACEIHGDIPITSPIGAKVLLEEPSGGSVATTLQEPQEIKYVPKVGDYVTFNGGSAVLKVESVMLPLVRLRSYPGAVHIAHLRPAPEPVQTKEVVKPERIVKWKWRTKDGSHGVLYIRTKDSAAYYLVVQVLGPFTLTKLQHPSVTYHVSLKDEGFCTCDGHHYSKESPQTCKHISALQALARRHKL